MNKQIKYYLPQYISHSEMLKALQKIPKEYRASCVITAEYDEICIQYSRPETQDEASERFMHERRKSARMIVAGKLAAGQELPECLKTI